MCSIDNRGVMDKDDDWELSEYLKKVETKRTCKLCEEMRRDIFDEN